MPPQTMLRRTEVVTILTASFILVSSVTGFAMLLIDPDEAERFLWAEALVLSAALISVWAARIIMARIIANRGITRP